MTTRYYIVPVIPDPIDGSRSPKYFSSMSYVAADYGLEPVMIVTADTTDTQHASITANVDVLALPDNLDNPFSGLAANRAKTALEGVNIPAQWIPGGMTYRQVLRAVRGMFDFAQRYNGLTGNNIFASGITLSTKFSQLGQAVQNRVLQVAQNIGLDTSFIASTTTIGDILANFAQQMKANPGWGF